MYRKQPSDSNSSRPDYSSVAPPQNFVPVRPFVPGPSVPSSYKPSASFGRSKRVNKFDDDYFDDDEEVVETQNKVDDDEEEDPLDAFMTNLQKSDSKAKDDSKAKPMTAKKKEIKGARDDIDKEDEEEAYYRYMEENPNAGLNTIAAGSDAEDDEEEGDSKIEYDDQGNVVVSAMKMRHIDPLPPVDHSTIDYKPFNKNFYEEHEEIKSMTESEAEELRKKLGIRVFGKGSPKPVCSFGHFGFDEQLMKGIIKAGYTIPTPIQAQAIPIALSGRDLIGVAKTGSGKTATYLWPLLLHIMDQSNLKPGDGPIGLILAPTRELVQQIYTEAKKFGKIYNIQVVCVYGGGNKYEQSKDLEAGTEIIVATPGRMIDMIKMKATNFNRVTCLILDEADRMFDLGFEPQVRSICDHVRPDRQTMLFSATFKKKIEKLARDVLTDPLKIIQGESGEANEDVVQSVHVFEAGPAKWNWLTSKLVEFLTIGSVLIFVTKKANADELAENLRMQDHNLLLIHGDMDQADRNKTITAFKKKEAPILVATDVAARGLDIPHIRTVINYDVARDIDTHTHRIGRTGRAGETGFAHTLVTEKDKEFVGHLVRSLEAVNQPVPDELLQLALQSSWFRSSRFKQGKATRVNIGGSGLGFRSRPEFGASSSTAQSTPSSSSSNIRMPSEAASDSSKLAAMRATFSNHYKTTFKAATDTAWQSKKPEENKGNNSSNEQPRKKRRWDNPDS